MNRVSDRICTIGRRLLALGATLAVALAVTSVAPVGAQQTASNDKIIVSGASGQLGELVVKELLARGVPAANLILVSRTPEQLKSYAEKGASVRFGDFTKPESLPAAYQGGTRLLLISIGMSGISRPQAHKNAIDAAKAAGVRQIAYTSWIGLSKNDASGIGTDHQATEDMLRASGVAWTMLRNSLYMDSILQQATAMQRSGRATVPPNEVKIGYVTREDCAAAAAAVLATPGHENKAYDITGPELVGAREIAAAVTAVTGRAVEVSSGAAGARGFGGPSAAIASDHVEKLTGRPATSVKAMLEKNRAALGG
jgi:NAD(P)H dehydrogenase (quinone)